MHRRKEKENDLTCFRFDFFYHPKEKRNGFNLIFNPFKFYWGNWDNQKIMEMGCLNLKNSGRLHCLINQFEE